MTSVIKKSEALLTFWPKQNFFTVVHLIVASTHKVEQWCSINFVFVISTWLGLSVGERQQGEKMSCKLLHQYRKWTHQTWNEKVSDPAEPTFMLFPIFCGFTVEHDLNSSSEGWRKEMKEWFSYHNRKYFAITLIMRYTSTFAACHK